MCKQTYVYYLIMLMCCGLHAQDQVLPEVDSSDELATTANNERQNQQEELPAIEEEASQTVDEVKAENQRPASAPEPQVSGEAPAQKDQLPPLEGDTQLPEMEPITEKEQPQEKPDTLSTQEPSEKPSEVQALQAPKPPMPSQVETPSGVKPESPTEGKVPYQIEPDEDDLLKIDTIDLSEPKGNWLLKRRWWEKAQRTYEKIKQQVEAIFESRMFFYNQRADLDRNVFANFYQQVGVGEGELQVIVSELIARLEQEDASKQSPEAKRYLSLLRAEKEKLISLQNKIDLVVEYDRSMNDALIKLREQINITRRYEQQAWNNFKQIAVELSDKRAHELFYVIKGLSKNIADISHWITKPYNDYFLKLLKALKQEIAHVKSMLQELKEKGIDVKQDIDEYLHEQSQKAEQEDQEIEEEEEQTFLQKTANIVAWPFVTLWNGLKSLGSQVAGFFGYVQEHEENELEELDAEQ